MTRILRSILFLQKKDIKNKLMKLPPPPQREIGLNDNANVMRQSGEGMLMTL